MNTPNEFDAVPADPSDRFFQAAAKNAELLRRIVAVMSGTEWSGDTFDAIADILRDGGYTLADVDESEDESDEWDAPTCLRWLAAHVAGPHHYADRAETWADEVARFAAYEGITPEEWNNTATDELRAAVRAKTREDRR